MRMFIFNVCMLYILLVLTPFQSQAAKSTQGWGHVSMHGSIINTACAIATGSRSQSIDMKTVPASSILLNNHGMEYPFSIKLINCELANVDPHRPDWHSFQVTFDGDTDADGRFFSVKGDAKGIALEIIDSTNKKALPGVAMPAEDIIEGNKDLNFRIKLVSNSKKLKSGRFYSIIRFKMDYY